MTTISVLNGKQIILGVTGSIACYKAADLASKLTQAGARVDVVLTAAAQQFVTSLTFQSVTGRPVFSDLWSERGHVEHVRLGEGADLLVIAPATAHTLAKLANGLADNLLTVTALAARCPLLIAPAMDGGMYAHPAVQENVARLAARGAQIIPPASGRMASGLTGIGRLPETPTLLAAIRRALGRDGALAGRRVVVTAGPTQEAIDPVRYLTNHSSGKQGVAIAQAALDMGAEVTLISGPLQVAPPEGATHIAIRSAQALHDAVLAAIPTHDLLVMTAAVADFRPLTVADQKIKKDPHSDAAPTIALTRNPDILLAVHARRTADALPLVVVGFAAETQDVLAHGRDKLRRKGLDFIAINDVAGSQTGFGVETNQITLIARDGTAHTLPLQSKAATAEQLLQIVAAALPARV